MTIRRSTDPLPVDELLDSKGRLLRPTDWKIPNSIEREGDWLAWSMHGGSSTAREGRGLLPAFIRLASTDGREATDDDIVQFARRWGVLTHCTHPECGGTHPLPRFVPAFTSVLLPTNPPSRVRLVDQRAIAHKYPDGRELLADWRDFARRVQALLSITGRLSARGSISGSEYAANEDDWQKVWRGRGQWRWLEEFSPDLGRSVPTGDASWEWREVGKDFTPSGQRKLVAWHVTQMLREAQVQPDLVWSGRAYTMRLRVGGLAGAIVTELALTIGDMRRLGEPCAGGCGRWIQPIRQRSGKCRWCNDREAHERWRQRHPRSLNHTSSSVPNVSQHPSATPIEGGNER